MFSEELKPIRPQVKVPAVGNQWFKGLLAVGKNRQQLLEACERVSLSFTLFLHRASLTQRV